VRGPCRMFVTDMENHLLHLSSEVWPEEEEDQITYAAVQRYWECVI
jgi:hypothetical protein